MGHGNPPHTSKRLDKARDFGEFLVEGLNLTEAENNRVPDTSVVFVLDTSQPLAGAQPKMITISGFNDSYRGIYRYVDQKITDLVDGAPELLDTLKELADAINDDPNYFLTVRSTINNVSATLNSPINGV